MHPKPLRAQIRVFNFQICRFASSGSIQLDGPQMRTKLAFDKQLSEVEGMPMLFSRSITPPMPWSRNLVTPGLVARDLVLPDNLSQSFAVRSSWVVSTHTQYIPATMPSSCKEISKRPPNYLITRSFTTIANHQPCFLQEPLSQHAFRTLTASWSTDTHH